DNPNLPVLHTMLPESLNCFCMCNHSIIRNLESTLGINNIRIMEVIQITALDRYNRLIEREPFRHAVTEQPETFIRILTVGVYYLSAFPAAFFLQFQRHIEMKQIDERFDVVGQKLINDIVVKCDSFLIDFAAPAGNQPCP